MIERWNLTVAEDDTVWHLGDFGVRLSQARATALLAHLQGTKHLIAGNNDGPEIRALPGWAAVRDRSLAEEAVQETFLRAWKYQDSFARRGSFEGWLIRICRNCVIDLAQRAARTDTTAANTSAAL